MERIRFDNLMGVLVNQVEATFTSLDAQMLDVTHMDSWGWWLGTRIFRYPGAREWWAVGSGAIHPDVRAWIDKVLESADGEDDVYALGIELDLLPDPGA